MKRGLFITFEGADGCGKTTQSKQLVDYLRRKNYPVVYTREPGGVKVSEELRKILLDPKTEVVPKTELFLYAASRVQHIEQLIRPALTAGKIVVCDRFNDATLAYQGYGRGLSLKMIRQLNAIATNGLVPDITILLDTEVKKSLSKTQLRKTPQDRLEKEDIGFHQRVRQGYLELAKDEPDRIKVISVARSVNKTQQQVRQIIDEFINKRGLK